MNEIATDPNAPLRRSVYWLLILISAGMMLGRILAVNSVDMAGLEANRLSKIPGELERKRQALLSQGVSGDALKRELAAAEKQLRQQAALQRPFLSANDRSRWATVRALVEDDMRVPGAPTPSTRSSRNATGTRSTWSSTRAISIRASRRCCRR